MTLIVTPVTEAQALGRRYSWLATAESVPADGTSSAGDSSTNNGANAHSTEASSIPSTDADAIAEKPQRTSSPEPLDAPHDYKQPA